MNKLFSKVSFHWLLKSFDQIGIMQWIRNFLVFPLSIVQLLLVWFSALVAFVGSTYYQRRRRWNMISALQIHVLMTKSQTFIFLRLSITILKGVMLLLKFPTWNFQSLASQLVGLVSPASLASLASLAKELKVEKDIVRSRKKDTEFLMIVIPKRNSWYM